MCVANRHDHGSSDEEERVRKSLLSGDTKTGLPENNRTGITKCQYGFYLCVQFSPSFLDELHGFVFAYFVEMEEKGVV